MRSLNEPEVTPTSEQPKKRGRGPNKRAVYKFDVKKRAEYIEKLKAGGRRHVSARAVGISPATICNLMRADPEFANAVSLAEMEADDEVEDALRTAAISGNVTACLAWLYSRRSERWQDTRHLRFDPTKMSDDDIAKAIKPILDRLGICLDPPDTKRLDAAPDHADGDGGAV